MMSHAVAEAIVASKSLASLRLRPNHASVRSTTHRLGRSSKPLARSERLTISTVHLPGLRRASLSFGPA